MALAQARNAFEVIENLIRRNRGGDPFFDLHARLLHRHTLTMASVGDELFKVTVLALPWRVVHHRHKIDSARAEQPVERRNGISIGHIEPGMNPMINAQPFDIVFERANDLRRMLKRASFVVFGCTRKGHTRIGCCYTRCREASIQVPDCNLHWEIDTRAGLQL